MTLRGPLEGHGSPRGLLVALGISVLVHGLLLVVRNAPPPGGGGGGAPRLEARLTPRSASLPAPQKPAVEPMPDKASARSAKASARPRLMTSERSRGPAVSAARSWTPAEKAEMDGFLNELAEQAKTTPRPTLAQRSLAMARQEAQQLAAADAAGGALLEARPNGPPADPFSLDLYMNALVRRLNQRAAFVRNDARARGIKTAAIRFRLNPDGSLKTFEVLFAGDQGDEIAFIREVVERSAPFSPFPPDIDRAARSLGVTVCIQPGSAGGFGFTRSSGRC